MRVTDALVAFLTASRIPDGDGWTRAFEPEGDDELQIFAGMLVAATALAFARVAIAFPDLDRPGRGTAARR